MNKDIDITGKIIKTQRLILRPVLLSDVNDMYEYAKVPGIGEAAGWPHHSDISITKNIINSMIEKKKTFAITYEGKMIGTFGIERYTEEFLPELNEKSGREIGYALSKDYWGRGFATEATKAVIDYLFNEIKLDFICCGASTTNNKSLRVQEKSGFKPFRYYSYTTIMGDERPSVYSILTKEDYSSSNKSNN